MVGATLLNAGFGEYRLRCPLVTSEGSVDVEATGYPDRSATGRFNYPISSHAGSSVTAGLCNLADVKRILNFTTGDFDQVLTDKIAAAESYFQTETGYNLVAANHTEYFSPGYRGGNVSTDMATLRVKEHPVISVASVVEDADRGFGGAVVSAADYYADSYRIRLYSDGGTRQFFPGQRTVRAIYRAGFEAIPSFLRNGVAHYAAILYYLEDPGRMRAAIASENIGESTVTYLNEEAPKIVVAAIRQYRRPLGL